MFFKKRIRILRKDYGMSKVKVVEEKRLCRKPGCGLIHAQTVPCWRAKMGQKAQCLVDVRHQLPYSGSGRVAKDKMSFKMTV